MVPTEVSISRTRCPRPGHLVESPGLRCEVVAPSGYVLPVRTLSLSRCQSGVAAFARWVGLSDTRSWHLVCATRVDPGWWIQYGSPGRHDRSRLVSCRLEVGTFVSSRVKILLLECAVQPVCFFDDVLPCEARNHLRDHLYGSLSPVNDHVR